MDENEFRSIRHRFWSLGRERRKKVLDFFGLVGENELLHEGVERQKLIFMRDQGRMEELVKAIELQEAEIALLNEKAEYVSEEEIKKAIAPPPMSGKVKLFDVEGRQVYGPEETKK